MTPRELGRLNDTRWACRYRNVSVIKERYGVIIHVLHEVQNIGDADITVQAKGLVFAGMQLYVHCQLDCFCRILSTAYGVTETLQSSNIDISESVKLITGMITTMSEFREKSQHGLTFGKTLCSFVHCMTLQLLVLLGMTVSAKEQFVNHRTCTT